MKPSITRLDNGNIDISLTIPWSDIKKAYEAEVDAAVQNAEVTGFRKGKAPRDLVEPKLDKDALYSQVIRKLLPDIYAAAVKDHSLMPILNPKVALTKGEEGSDWEFIATVCEAPPVTLPEKYSDEIKKLKPKEESKKLETVLDYLHQKSKVKVPDLLIEEESNHRIAHLVENITRLGLTTENYLQTKKLTPEDLKAQTTTQTRTDLEMEFILNQIRLDQKLEDRKKTLDFLTSLI